MTQEELEYQLYDETIPDEEFFKMLMRYVYDCGHDCGVKLKNAETLPEESREIIAKRIIDELEYLGSLVKLVRPELEEVARRYEE